MTDVFAAATDVTVTVDLIDTDGTVITPVSATYTVGDDEGVELASGAIAVDGSETSLSVTVPSANNQLDAGETIGARMVVISVVDARGTHLLRKGYLIESAGVLAVPAESGMTLATAEIVALRMPSLTEWPQADMHLRQAALVEAWSRLARLKYRPFRDFDDVEGVASKLLRGTFRLNELTDAEWQALPDPFRAALRRAQLVEADVILDGDPTWARRVDGLMSKTVGESSEMFRPGKPVITAVSMRAMRELSGFIDFSARVGRG